MTPVHREINILVMAGGEASRIHGLPKTMLKVCGKPVVERVINEARRAFHGKIYVSVSMRDTSLIARLRDVEWIVTWGTGFSSDLAYSLDKTGYPLLVLPGDMPFLDHDILKRIVMESWETPWSTVSIKVPPGCKGLEVRMDIQA
jgi:GTP:adenosylcobinamide-phosphate guanylyltransferase